MAVGTMLVHDGVVYLLVLSKMLENKTNEENKLNDSGRCHTHPYGACCQIYQW